MNNFIQPEFCAINYLDENINPDVSTTVTAGTGVGSTDLLWDYRSDATLISSGSSDGNAFEITVDLGSDQYVDTIKLLGINFGEFTVSIKTESAGTYTTMATETTYRDSGYHLYMPNTPSDTFLMSEDGDYLFSEGGDPLVAETFLTRYVKVACTDTQFPDAEKEIGELYVGYRVFQNATGTCQDLQETHFDDLRDTQTTSRGKALVSRGEGAFGTTLKYRGLSSAEFIAAKAITKSGGNFTFFPTGGQYAQDMSPTFDYADIYLVTSTEDFTNNPWGMGNSTDAVSITVKETVNVG
jgi:hypothetical protein